MSIFHYIHTKDIVITSTWPRHATKQPRNRKIIYNQRATGQCAIHNVQQISGIDVEITCNNRRKKRSRSSKVVAPLRNQIQKKHNCRTICTSDGFRAFDFAAYAMPGTVCGTDLGSLR
eukprot:2006761-Rhodomonas_salina.1